MNNKISSIRYIGCCHKKDAFMPPDRRCINSPGSMCLFQIQLFFRIQTISQQFPVCQIPAVIQRNSREKFKTGVDKIKISAPPGTLTDPDEIPAESDFDIPYAHLLSTLSAGYLWKNFQSGFHTHLHFLLPNHNFRLFSCFQRHFSNPFSSLTGRVTLPTKSRM